MYADAGYVTESTLAQAESQAMELLGPTRPDPHKGPYNADGFVVDVDHQRAVCPRERPALNAATSKTATWELCTTGLSGAVNATIVLYTSNARALKVGAGC